VKKNMTGLVIVILIVFFLFGNMASAFSPVPTGFGVFLSGPPGWFPGFFAPAALPVLPPLDEPKMGLSAEEATALSNMTPGTSTFVWFKLPAFFGNQELTWTSSDPSVATVTALPGRAGRINAKGPGTALITVSTPDGAYTYSFLVTVR